LIFLGVNQSMKTFKVGYIFKPTHNEIHYLKKGANGDRRKKYSNNYTTDFHDAESGNDEEKAKAFIVQLVARFPPDDEYTWTPVLVDVENKTFRRYWFNQWSNEAIKIKWLD
jgi:hypothetical protein